MASLCSSYQTLIRSVLLHFGNERHDCKTNQRYGTELRTFAHGNSSLRGDCEPEALNLRSGKAMRAAKAIRWTTTLLLSVAGILGWNIITRVPGNSETIAEANSQATAEVPPIPPDGPMALPKSLDQVGLPLDAVRAAVPADNPQTPEKVALGEKLFFDGRLSVDGTVACSTCHDPARAFSDGREVSIGVKGHAGQRNAPTILNALFNSAQFGDGRAKTLEQQAGLPIINPMEMGQPGLEAAAANIAEITEYAKEFQRVFGRPPNPTQLERAIASYERTQVSFDSPFDHFMARDNSAISASAKHGWELFNTKARCFKCHALSDEKRDPTYFMDRDFHNIGIGIIRHNVVAEACKAQMEVDSGNTIQVDRAAIQSDMSVLGRFLVTKKDADIASFKTPGCAMC
jgi:cytochrome c peroxidase